MTDQAGATEPATTAACLRITGATDPDQAQQLTERVANRLDARLARWNRDQVELHLAVRHPDTAQQKVTLEAWIAQRGDTHFVGTSDLDDMWDAVADAATDVRRQVAEFVDRRITDRHT